MNMSLELKLKKKGWPIHEIDKVMRVIHRGEHNKSWFSKFTDAFIFWLALIVCIIGNFFISMLLIPMLLIIKGFYLFVILSMVGVTVGILFELIVCTLESMEKKKYIISGIFVPFLALINVFLISQLSNSFSSLMHVSAGVHNSVVISVVYVASFLVPYIVHKIKIYEKITIRLHAIP